MSHCCVFFGYPMDIGAVQTVALRFLLDGKPVTMVEAPSGRGMFLTVHATVPRKEAQG